MVLAGMLATAAAVQAVTPPDRSSYTLRYFGLDQLSSQPYQTYLGSDNFNNADPYTGLFYESPELPSNDKSGIYRSSTFSAGAENAGPAGDFIGRQYGVGGLAFRVQDATLATSNLTPAPYDQYALSLSPNVVPGTALGLASKSVGLDSVAVWNYQAPEPGSAVILSLAGSGVPAGGGTGDYSDRLQLRLGTDYRTGQTFVSFEQQASTAGVLTRTTLESHALADLLPDLAQVDYVQLGLSRDEPNGGNPNPQVHANVTLFDAATTADGALVELANFSFAAGATLFVNGEFSSVYNAVSWMDPLPVPTVPEPPALALLLAGVATLGQRLRRARNGGTGQSGLQGAPRCRQTVTPGMTCRTRTVTGASRQAMSLRRWTGAALLAGLSTVAAHAAPVTYEFSGTIEGYYTHSVPGVPIGAEFTGSFTYDPSATEIPGAPGQFDAVSTMTATVSGLTYASTTYPSLRDITVTNGPTDSVVLNTYDYSFSDPYNTGPTIGTLMPYFLYLDLSDTSGQALSDQSLPGTLSLASFHQSTFYFNWLDRPNGDAEVTAYGALSTLHRTGTQIIPEPSTAALVGVALAGIGLSRRRRSADGGS